ncbi:UDP-N-acetylmuramoyl-L-alanyl-D-glutamate--2,6-diaminopimelate ligase [Dictyoglomus thermophilum]|uniref:UDP-N-acetylmuramoyl-L-alanyl-D-glutamate--2,6-diaminopimelate ligase n=1 Tax=Dictyoglomus thermophilum (strain ATCC 35947 / DSM 3960 / H-6-12) TaxID=309799 RepID=B5YEL8_DICT6|nr:UDP-N-acetylmuramoyl-L-alanyl-D-glutamate--2,6-diaminopimelate ligase [Dictyoglomus thermophilum]ACI19085.1 UDP-N-acetylmuramoylalanyl-D-glutamate--2,6-diaminopimelate ligase [Dictyoglomus thermophilum H-6-12]MCX7719763.1 UDP-N-acetylmuramoyl-L-alanyl-D-glutamate--2,6-diaminopimelate ligase [Dictyoglomus thermophilum]TYT21191.1 UDP-N-acetylmuramoyl-L-alanyl-D-glutamate--2,6-diaminopimelate ligase [Dictyoglomus thermophilum]
MKKLKEIVEYIKDHVIEVIGDVDLNITGIATDSRKVRKGNIFFALPGTKDDGKNYISDAISKGASAVFLEGEVNNIYGVPLVRVREILDVLSKVSSYFYDFPSKYLNIIGVTGTNGKTTTTNLLYHYWKSKGIRSGLIGTIEYKIDDESYPSNFTTPQPQDLQEILRKMVDREVKFLAMEISSHALALKRVDGISLKGAVFTNLTQDHLDFHKTMEEYFQAKLKIFNYLEDGGFAVINRDNEWTGRISLPNRRVFWVSLKNGDLYLKKHENTNNGMLLEIGTPLGDLIIDTKLKGKFNIYNILFAVGVLIGLGEPLEDISKFLSTFKGVKGRLELIREGQNFDVIVDYAHTPDGLFNVLQTVKEFTKGRVIVVFGCGGDRDPTKRDKMGEISARLADIVIVTSDNPRTEDPLKIIRQIEEGIRRVGRSDYFVIENREEAIKKAIEIAGEGDSVLIAGKGHEDYQIIGNTKIPFSDQEVAKKYILERLKNES